MSDIKKVIKGLEECSKADFNSCMERVCPYAPKNTNNFCDCRIHLLIDARELLKEQKAVEPYMDFDGHDVWRCGKCGSTIFHIYHNASDEDAKNYAKFCRHCGREVKWE